MDILLGIYVAVGLVLAGSVFGLKSLGDDPLSLTALVAIAVGAIWPLLVIARLAGAVQQLRCRWQGGSRDKGASHGPR